MTSPDLDQLLGFDRLDLAANRSGRLSPAQQAWFDDVLGRSRRSRRTARRIWTLILLVVVGGGVAAAFATGSADRIRDALDEGGAGLAWGAGVAAASVVMLVAIIALAGSGSSLRSDDLARAVAEGRVLAVDGELRCTAHGTNVQVGVPADQEDSRMLPSDWSVTIGGRSVTFARPLPPGADQVLADAGPCRGYLLPWGHGAYLLSAERLDSD